MKKQFRSLSCVTVNPVMELPRNCIFCGRPIGDKELWGASASKDIVIRWHDACKEADHFMREKIGDEVE